MKIRGLWASIGIVLLGTGALRAQTTGGLPLTPTATPTPTSAPAMIYNNTDTAVAAALGCAVAIVDEVRQLNLDITTSYILMRLCALGENLQAILQMRLTLGWDEICARFAIDWSSFSTDLQTRIQALQPEMITPNQVIRGAANDPSQFPITQPSPMPDNLIVNAPITEVCPLCQ